MNKPLKYRVWDSVLNLFETKHILIKPDGTIGILGMQNSQYIEANANRFIIQPYSLLNDSIGTEIYEGDILKSESYIMTVKYGYYRQSETFNIEQNKLHTVHYDHVGFFVNFKRDNEEYEHTLAITNTNSIVIGNIFENPELISL